MLKFNKSYSVQEDSFEEHPLGIVVKGICSSEAIDSHNDIVLAEAMEKAIPDYLANNPYIKEMHRSDSLAGKALGVFVQDKVTYLQALVCDLSSINKFKAKLLKAFSIGGYITDYEIRADGVRVIKAMILEEISLVTDPSNPQSYVHSFGKSINLKGKTMPQENKETDVKDAGQVQATQEQVTPVVEKAQEGTSTAQDTAQNDADVSDVVVNDEFVQDVVAKAQAEIERLSAELVAMKDTLEAEKAAAVEAIAKAKEEQNKINLNEVNTVKLANKFLQKEVDQKNDALTKAQARVAELENLAITKGVCVGQKSDDVIEASAQVEAFEKSAVILAGKVDRVSSLGKLLAMHTNVQK